MAHPLRSDTNASRAAKLKSMTEDYGGADPAANKFPGVEKYKLEGPEEDVGFGADSGKPKLHGARVSRDTKPANPYATYKRGGAVKRRSSGGDTSDIEQADIDQKLESRRRGGHVKRRDSGGSADATLGTGDRMMISKPDTTGDKNQVQTTDDQGKLLSGPYKGLTPKKHGGAVKRAHGGRVRGEKGPMTVYPPDVKMGAKYATVSSEPSPTPVDNRARGGSVKRQSGGGLYPKLGYSDAPPPQKPSGTPPQRRLSPLPDDSPDKRARGGRTKGKGGTHVNILVGHGGQPMAPPVSAMPAPPPMPPAPRPPMGGPPPGAMPPGAGMMPGMPPGGMPPPPGAVPPGIMPPRKRGGRVVKKHHHDDKAEDMKMIKSAVKESALKPHGSMRAAGGRVGLTAGAASGEGRLEKAAAHKRSGRHATQEV